jgi:radical SAM superfamily enzyme YgiQ (UPF0313 family)
VRPLEETLDDVALAGRRLGPRVEKVFVADGDALVLGLEPWEAILRACRAAFPNLRQVSCYATAQNVLAKTQEDLLRLRSLGLLLLYLGPESGDDPTLKRIAKGVRFDDFVAASERAHAAGLRRSAIFLLGAGGRERSQEHAQASARLATAMDPEYLAALTLTVIPGTPIARLEADGRFVLPDVAGLLRELRIFVDEARPRFALFRTNHASNHLPIGGHLPRDREPILRTIDAALAGALPLRPESARGL